MTYEPSICENWSLSDSICASVIENRKSIFTLSSGMEIALIVGYLILLSWVALVLLWMMRSVKVLPQTPPLMVFLLAFAMAAMGFALLPLFYVVLLLITLIVSGFVGGLAYGYVRLDRNKLEGLHVMLALFSILSTILGLLGFVALDLPIRLLMMGGILLVSFGEGFREVMSALLGEFSGPALVLMLGASALLIPTMIPGSGLFLDGAGLIGALIGLFLRYGMHT